MCNWRNADHREGACSIEKPFAWAEVREIFSCLFMLLGGDNVGTGSGKSF